MKTVPLSTVFMLLHDIAYKMQQIDVDELDADYEQHLQRERNKPPELTASKSTRLSQTAAERMRKKRQSLNRNCLLKYLNLFLLVRIPRQ